MSQGELIRGLGLGSRIKAIFPTGQVVRYLIVGAANTVLGIGTSVAVLYLLNRLVPGHLFGFTITQAILAMTASVLVYPLNVTVSYLNYKLFVFRTKGNHLREWIKAFGVYGVSNLIGLVALGALTRAIEILLHGHAPFGKGTPGYIAMVAMTAVTTAVSYLGHKNVTFKTKPAS